MITGKDVGYDAYATRIAVYVDNTLVARFDNSRGGALTWQHAVARFTGNGGRRDDTHRYRRRRSLPVGTLISAGVRWRSNRLPRSAASAVETSNGSNAVIHQNIAVHVEATAQAPMLTLAPGLAPLSRSLVDTSWVKVNSTELSNGSMASVTRAISGLNAIFSGS